MGWGGSLRYNRRRCRDRRDFSRCCVMPIASTKRYFVGNITSNASCYAANSTRSMGFAGLTSGATFMRGTTFTTFASDAAFTKIASLAVTFTINVIMPLACITKIATSIYLAETRRRTKPSFIFWLDARLIANAIAFIE